MQSLNPIFDRLKTNSRGFWKVYRWLIILFLISLIADGISTVCFMLRAGAELELHPAIYFVSTILGPIAGPVVSVIAKGLGGVIVAVYCRRFAAYIFAAGIIISFFAAWYNVRYAL